MSCHVMWSIQARASEQPAKRIRCVCASVSSIIFIFHLSCSSCHFHLHVSLHLESSYYRDYARDCERTCLCIFPVCGILRVHISGGVTALFCPCLDADVGDRDLHTTFKRTDHATCTCTSQLHVRPELVYYHVQLPSHGQHKIRRHGTKANCPPRSASSPISPSREPKRNRMTGPTDAKHNSI